MKSIMLSLGVLFASILVQARTIDCVDLKNEETIVSLTDDMGSMVNGWFKMGGVESNFPQTVAYSYYYGEYLTIKETNHDEEVLEIVAVKNPNSNEFIGFLNFYQPYESVNIYVTKIRCFEK